MEVQDRHDPGGVWGKAPIFLLEHPPPETASDRAATASSRPIGQGVPPAHRISYRVIVDFISATTTKTGLAVRCELDSTLYPKGIIVTDREMIALNIKCQAFNNECNYARQPINQLDKAVITG